VKKSFPTVVSTAWFQAPASAQRILLNNQQQQQQVPPTASAAKEALF